jgi:hypothetical protein
MEGIAYLAGENLDDLLEDLFQQKHRKLESSGTHLRRSMQSFIHLGTGMGTPRQLPSYPANSNAISQRDVLEAKDPLRVVVSHEDAVHTSDANLKTASTSSYINKQCGL